MANRGLTAVLASLCVSLFCGCAYFEDRTRDAADMITIAGEFPMIGAAAWVGRWGATMSGGEGHGFGLRSGAVGAYEFSEGGFIFVGLKELEPSEADRARGKGYQGGFPLDEHCGGGLRGGWFNYGQIEVVAGVGPGVRAGVNIFEIADFILGWASVDICSDDIASRRKSLSAGRDGAMYSFRGPLVSAKRGDRRDK